MNKAYTISLHTVNLLFLGVIFITVLASFSNISDGAISPINPVNISVMTVLLLFWISNYILQIKKKNTKWLLPVGSILFISLFLTLLGVVLPYFYNSMY